jgi:3-oxoacyl-[acyl-carrier-protein] synthase-3
MAFLSFSNVKISGVAAAVPKKIKEIKDLPFFAPGEAEKVINLTHIERSRIAPDGMCCSDLCFAAANKLLDSLKWDRSEIDVLIYVSLSRDYLTPATSAILQDRLGLSKDCYAIDIPLACSGYVYGLSVITSLMSCGMMHKGLLLVGETTSVLQSPMDKTIWPLHGDAGTATAIEYKDGAEPICFNFGTDGSRWEAIINPDGGSRHPFTAESLKMVEIEPGVVRNRLQSILDGMNVFGFSITVPPKSIKSLCEHFDIDIDTIDYLFLHQANKYMDDKIGKKLKVPNEKIPFCLMQFGNTSSASIPMTIVTAVGEKISKQTASAIMCGFGSGLSWGSAYVVLDHIVCPELIELDLNEKD